MHCMTRNDCNKNAVQLVTLFMQYGFSKYNNYSEANHLSFGSGKELHPPSPPKLSHKCTNVHRESRVKHWNDKLNKLTVQSKFAAITELQSPRTMSGSISRRECLPVISCHFC